MASYDVNPDAVARCRELIEKKQYVLDSDWGERPARRRCAERLPRAPLWEEYAAWHLGLTEGATRRDQGAATRSSTATSGGCTGPR